MNVHDLALEVLPVELAVCSLPPGTPVPDWAWSGRFSSVCRTDHELSVVCDASSVPASVTTTRGWRAFEVLGPLDFGLVGILAGLSTVLADAEIPIFAVSTRHTDYILVRQHRLGEAVDALRRAGYVVGTGVDGGPAESG